MDMTQSVVTLAPGVEEDLVDVDDHLELLAARKNEMEKKLDRTSPWYRNDLAKKEGVAMEIRHVKAYVKTRRRMIKFVRDADEHPQRVELEAAAARAQKPQLLSE